ncbi:S-ribosylhomocysteine lyase [Rhodanobacter sp. AS-Z3]|uniref:S-ribosylhomocysteine lyase n=1 Tax=Rhodanobacter sp. AS-Z3 TaxID=3031330 RepID=UPI002479E656|nr:S-ribosylhomocysteine lyase [Rhodanobacter sp. AS-Z3]WEN15827.1 S-ribosylhomocysteine lyase [Rhodanobacter sp. AS-Z3]
MKSATTVLAMAEIQALGWQARWVGELDHGLLRAPSVKLRSARCGRKGDVVYGVDLRVCRPNADQYLSTTALHSLEHVLLEGLQRHLPEHFISVGVMGCQTGFYLVFLNEGRAEVLCDVLAEIFAELLDATEVPYQHSEQCGNYRNHDLRQAQDVARRILQARARWLEAT